MEQFDYMLSPVIDSTLGHRYSSVIGYQIYEIVCSLISVYFCGSSCVEDVTSHLMHHLSYHPTLRTCSSDTTLRAIKELTQENISYTSEQGKTYDFYKTIMGRLDTKAFGLGRTSRLKASVFRFISVPAKWIMTASQYVLNIYTENRAYAKPSKRNSDKTLFFPVRICVLPQVAWWGKG